MLETIVLLLVIIMASSFVSLFTAFSDTALDTKFKLPEDSVLRRHFLTQLKNEVEASGDWTLKRRYRRLVAACNS